MKTSLETKIEELKKLGSRNNNNPINPSGNNPVLVPSTLSVPSSPQPSGESTKTHVQHILDCPECRKELAEKIKKNEIVQCVNCRSLLDKGVLDDKEKACPTCGSKTARRLNK